MFKKSDLNKIMQIDFYDHVMAGQDTKPELCSIFGRLIKITDDYIIVRFWESECNDDVECFTIIRSTIIKRIILNNA